MNRYGSTTGIGDITVDKAALIETLRVNRAQHEDVFLRACTQFQERAIQELEGVMAVIRSGKVPRMVGVSMPIPEQHTDDYDRAIAMLERHIGETVTLSEEAYARLVDDDWGWRDAFASSTVAYLDRHGGPPPRA